MKRLIDMEIFMMTERDHGCLAISVFVPAADLETEMVGREYVATRTSVTSAFAQAQEQFRYDLCTH